MNNEVALPILDGSIPLHFLASLGAFRLVSLVDPGAHMAWTPIAPYIPLLYTRLNENECERTVVEHLRVRGSVALRNRQRRLEVKLKRTLSALAECPAGKACAAKKKQLTNEGKIIKRRLKRLDAVFRTMARDVLAKHHPFAGKADCIHKICRADFRALVQQEKSQLWEYLFPGLASDSEQEEGLSRTRFSFSNGGSGKALLKDWLTNLSCLRAAREGEAHLFGFSLEAEKVTGLMWSSDELRDHALRWRNPNDEDTYSIPLLNVLAFVGLSFFPVLPSIGRSKTVGFGSEDKAFVWPIWASCLSPDLVACLLNSSELWERGRTNGLGISCRFRAEAILVNKRNYFARTVSF